MENVRKKIQATILLLDDEKSILSSLKRLLHREIETIHLAENGQKALDFLAKNPVDLVISDMRMPEMDGATFLAAMAEQHPQTKRFLLTGYSDLESTIKAVNEGKIHHFLQKPWHDEKVVSLVRETLETMKIKSENTALKATNEQQLIELNALNAQLIETNNSLEEKVKQRTETLEEAQKKLSNTVNSLRELLDDVMDIFTKMVKQQEGKNCFIDKSFQLIELFSKDLQLSEININNFRMAALLARVGYLSIPDPIRAKAYSLMDKNERDIYHAIPVTTETLFLGMKQLNHAALIVRHYREKHDGSGYPDNIAGNKIPLGSRLLAIITDFFELQLGKIVDDKLTANEAVQYLIDNADTTYDSNLVEQFKKFIGKVDEELYLAELKTSSAGLQVGMCVSRDVFNAEGALLIPENTILTDKMVTNLQALMHNKQSEFVIYIRN